MQADTNRAILSESGISRHAYVRAWPCPSHSALV